MTPEFTPFDHRPDPVLGSALRAALAPGDEPAFIARVLARFDGRPIAYWDVLASWAQAGIALAAAAVVAGILIGARQPPSTLDDVLADGAGYPARVVVDALRPPDPSVVLTLARPISE